METDQVPYIFGSFSRRRQSEEPIAAKRRSLGAAIAAVGSGAGSAVDSGACSGEGSGAGTSEERFACPLCRRSYSEPRVLPCLHTFCTRCLKRLRPPANEDTAALPWNGIDDSDVSINGKGEGSGSQSGSGSAGSGYESEQRDTSSDGSWTTHYNGDKTPKQKSPRHYGVYTKKISGKAVQILVCPTCSAESRLPAAGILALPPNFVLQHRMFVAALNRDTSRLLCDLCSSDVPASTRCTTCLISLCGGCCAAHLRQRGASRHSVLPLADATLTLRRQPLCPRHPDNELKLFCTTCCQVICRDCCLMLHSGHSFDPVSRAAESYIRSIREAVDRVKPVARQTTTALEKLQSAAKRIQIKSGVVQDEVEQFIDSYIRAVEEHRQTLQMQVMKARDVKIQAITTQRLELEKRAENVNDAVQFAEDILAEGTDVEVLSFVGPLLRRLEWCSNTEGLFDLRASENLQLIREEKILHYGGGNHQLYGIVSTQSVEPRFCIIDLEALRGARVHRAHEIIVETRDTSDQPLCRGGESVLGVLRKPNFRPRPITVHDRRDGTYLLTFVPDTPGNLQLAILVNGKSIKGSPFLLTVRSINPHHGKFHCCTFCSSGGSKDAECACEGRMSGGYKGCGHGHDGHPGARHWSCCGNTQQQSECLRANSAIYQFSL